MCVCVCVRHIRETRLFDRWGCPRVHLRARRGGFTARSLTGEVAPMKVLRHQSANQPAGKDLQRRKPPATSQVAEVR